MYDNQAHIKDPMDPERAWQTMKTISARENHLTGPRICFVPNVFTTYSD